MAGLTGNNLLVSSSIQYVINVCLTVPALLYVDRWGRRPGLLLGALGMLTSMFANAGLLASYGHYAGPQGVANTPEASWSISGPPSKAVIACTYLFVACFAPTWGPVSWIYLLNCILSASEAKPLHLPYRLIGSSTSHSATLCPQPSRISNGRHTSSLVSLI